MTTGAYPARFARAPFVARKGQLPSPLWMDVPSAEAPAFAGMMGERAGMTGWGRPGRASPAFAALRVPLRCAKGTGDHEGCPYGFRLAAVLPLTPS